MKLPGKLSVRRTLKILPGVRLSGSLNGLNLLLGAMGVTYSIPLIRKTKPSKAVVPERKPDPPGKARADANQDRQFNTRDAFLVTGRRAARELCTQLDEKIVIINVVDDTHVEYWSGKTFHKVRAEVFSFWLDNNELERLEADNETSDQSESEDSGGATQAKPT